MITIYTDIFNVFLKNYSLCFFVVVVGNTLLFSVAQIAGKMQQLRAEFRVV